MSHFSKFRYLRSKVTRVSPESLYNLVKLFLCRFLLKPEVKEPEAKPREFLHGFSVLPERYTGKVVLNLLYGYHDRIPEESKIQNDKHQLYVSVTHLFDFSRYEILNKKKPRIAFLLRPYDKSFPYPRGANKYRTVELDRRSGVISGCNNYLTFEISPDTLLKRCLFIRVKAYKGKVPSAFLGNFILFVPEMGFYCISQCPILEFFTEKKFNFAAQHT